MCLGVVGQSIGLWWFGFVLRKLESKKVQRKNQRIFLENFFKLFFTLATDNKKLNELGMKLGVTINVKTNRAKTSDTC